MVAILKAISNKPCRRDSHRWTIKKTFHGQKIDTNELSNPISKENDLQKEYYNFLKPACLFILYR
jgi:hypothetical protein